MASAPIDLRFNVEIKIKETPLEELIGRVLLTQGQMARVYDNHDDGDEHPRQHMPLMVRSKWRWI